MLCLAASFKFLTVLDFFLFIILRYLSEAACSLHGCDTVNLLCIENCTGISPTMVELKNLNFQPLEVVGRCSESQLQVGEKTTPHICLD